MRDNHFLGMIGIPKNEIAGSIRQNLKTTSLKNSSDWIESNREIKESHSLSSLESSDSYQSTASIESNDSLTRSSTWDDVVNLFEDSSKDARVCQALKAQEGTLDVASYKIVRTKRLGRATIFELHKLGEHVPLLYARQRNPKYTTGCNMIISTRIDDLYKSNQNRSEGFLGKLRSGSGSPIPNMEHFFITGGRRCLVRVPRGKRVAPLENSCQPVSRRKLLDVFRNSKNGSLHTKIYIQGDQECSLRSTEDPENNAVDFQLVHAGFLGDSVALLSFKRVAENIYQLDFAYPFSPFLAFAICLSKFS